MGSETVKSTDDQVVKVSSGRRRSVRTRRSVLIIDKIADWTIRIGGVAVILAVVGILFFLLHVVAPLFLGSKVSGQIEAQGPSIDHALVGMIDEYRTLAVTLTRNGRLVAFHIPTGNPLNISDVKLDADITAVAFVPGTGDIALGSANGEIYFGHMAVQSKIMSAAELPPSLHKFGNQDLADDQFIYSPLPDGQYRRLGVIAKLEPPQLIAPNKPIVALDYQVGGTAERPSRAFVSADQDGMLRLTISESKTNLLTRKTSVSLETFELPVLPVNTKISHLLMGGNGAQVYAAERSGRLFRFDARDPAKATLAEIVDLTPGQRELAALEFLNGEQAIAAGLSDGAVDIYFRLQRSETQSSDGYALVKAHQLEAQKASILKIIPSLRSKSFVTMDETGSVWLRHMTTEQTLLKLVGPKTLQTLALSPREDGLIATAPDGKYVFWHIALGHPETTFKSVFGKIWYEGYQEPSYTWQSSSGTDTFEPKLSLIPLIFGTIKATLYCMLFAVPIALAAAIFTSEFIHRDLRAVVKPAMEMMASLPSVVLGFVAALVLAPFVETWIAAVILTFVTVPLGLLLGAYIWQILPQSFAIRYGSWQKFILMAASIIGSGYLAYSFSQVFENWFFAGDFKAWSDGAIGSDMPFLTLLLLPIVGLMVGFFLRVSEFTKYFRHFYSAPAGIEAFVRWVIILIISVSLSAISAYLATLAGIGLRGNFINTYVQRNSLVVGFAMGFAVIPIIYTIAEDALNAVPEHLRAASLACGATPWQTAIAVILPTAMSGIFAAIMIGMGRAVGETMIVVMVAGNTPIIDWNIFNGLRALSANIAVELPEAVKDSTLYRMLFLAAMVLFAMTFIINTLAEFIRQRFRKRAAQL